MRRLMIATHQECQPPQPPLPPSISRTGGDTATSRFLATWMSLIHTLHVRPLSQRCATRPWHKSLCTVKWNPIQGLALPPLLDGKDWDKPMEHCCWTCRDQLIWPYRQASLGGITSLRLWSLDPMMLPGNRIKTHVLKYELSSQLIWKPHFPECHEPWEAIKVILIQV